MSISGPARGRFDKTEEIFASIRLERPDGSFAGVALAPVLTSFFERSFVNVDVGQHGNITLFRDDGTILARKPPIFLGVQFPQAALLAGSRRAMEGGSYMTSAAADGNAHLFAFRHVRGYPLIIRVGVAENEYLADWIADTEKKGIGAVVILIIVVILAVSLDRQIGQRKLAEIRLAELALLDGLTGLANRRLFDEVLDREWRQAGRSRTSIALLMIDVDYFKAYNDFYGHHAGDKILIQIAQTIAADLKRPGDLVARYGGEEFVVILPAADVRSALTVAERIREVISGLHVAHAPAESGMLSVSIGLAAFVPSRRGAATDLIEAADAALYDAKRTGRNRVAVSSRSEAYERSD
jgi:diguanylate cyclase (GGDEF)-like protein